MMSGAGSRLRHAFNVPDDVSNVASNVPVTKHGFEVASATDTSQNYVLIGPAPMYDGLDTWIETLRSEALQALTPGIVNGVAVSVAAASSQGTTAPLLGVGALSAPGGVGACALVTSAMLPAAIAAKKTAATPTPARTLR